MSMSVRTLCLGILSFQDATGYEIKKMVEEGLFSHFIDASFGSIYPALARMLKDGLVTVRTEEQPGKPSKKVYSITDKGRSVLAQAVNTDPARDKFKSEFLFQILLMQHATPEHLAIIYDAYIEEQEAELERICSCGCALPDHVGARFVNEYGQAMLKTAIDFLHKRRDEILSQAAARASDEGEEQEEQEAAS